VVPKQERGDQKDAPGTGTFRIVLTPGMQIEVEIVPGPFNRMLGLLSKDSPVVETTWLGVMKVDLSMAIACH
jgi:hypothetical protein